jgi:hypothetical protein
MAELSQRAAAKEPLYVTFMDLLWDWVDLIDARASKRAEEDTDVGCSDPDRQTQVPAIPGPRATPHSAHRTRKHGPARKVPRQHPRAP